jgi:hypothetical protein
MRFYNLPASDGKTVCVNFDHVAAVHVLPKTIELHFVGTEAPTVIPKTPASLVQVAKGMDLSEASKELLNSL